MSGLYNIYSLYSVLFFGVVFVLSPTLSISNSWTVSYSYTANATCGVCTTTPKGFPYYARFGCNSITPGKEVVLRTETCPSGNFVVTKENVADAETSGCGVITTAEADAFVGGCVPCDTCVELLEYPKTLINGVFVTSSEVSASVNDISNAASGVSTNMSYYTLVNSPSLKNFSPKLRYVSLTSMLNVSDNATDAANIDSAGFRFYVHFVYYKLYYLFTFHTIIVYLFIYSEQG